GQMTRDNDAWDEREKQYGPPVEEKEKKHKIKTAKLPSITTTVKNRAPPPHDAKKLRKLDGHFLSSHSPPEESNFEKKSGPIPPAKKPAPTIPTYPSFGTAKQSTNFSKFARTKQSKPSAPKYPIGFAPIKRPKPVQNALVQTDETDFPAAILKEPGLRMYSSKDSFDSGLGSLPSRYWKDSQSNFDQINSGLNSRRSSLSHEYTKISFIFLYDGKFGIEIDENGQKRMLKNIFDNGWTPLYLSMAESGIEIGETAQFHHCDYPKHVIYDILKIIGKPFNEINMDPKWGFEIVENNGITCFQIETQNGKRMIPEEMVLAAFLKTMKARAETYLNEDVKEICLSTNFKVTESQRNIFNKAAMKVNLEIKLFDFINYE
uniref:Uncharacterized protein n=1 Tax=Panagrolaimus sp. PS1159 TaxID=55785 RepID=A0AC35GJC5_9BILA